MPPSRKTTARRVILWLTPLAAILVVYLGYVAWRIWKTAGEDEARPAAAVVVFGAAEYRGRPSPVLRARIEHTLALYQRGVAPRIITTGGPGGDPNFTEAGVARNFLVARGVPSEAIVMEDESSSTTETVLNVAEIMRRNGERSAVVVSDGYHLFRIKQLFAEKGIQTFGSPRAEKFETSFWFRFRATMHEVLGYIAWKVHVRV